MNIKIIMVLTLITSSSAFGWTAKDCEPYIGQYSWDVLSNISRADSPISKQIKISFEAATNILDLKFSPFKNSPIPEWTEIYIADGSNHPGDGKHTGDTYLATCSNGQIKIIRNMEKFIAPVIMKLKLLNDQPLQYLRITNWFEGYENYATEMNLERD